MIDYLNGTISEEQSNNIELHIKKYPYYKDILKGLLIEIEELSGKEKILDHLEEEKEKTIALLFSTTNI